VTSDLPRAPQAQGRYVPVVVHGGLAYVAGMTPRVNGVLTVQGLVGTDLTAGAAFDAAGIAARNAVAAVVAAVGGFDAIARCLRMTVYIACSAGFTDHAAVADGASQAIHELLGDRGQVARSAVGVASLPSGAPVEVELTVAIHS
jgi:enamine deaminase RidA (YjgF/YER057c/UK114 family)